MCNGNILYLYCTLTRQYIITIHAGGRARKLHLTAVDRCFDYFPLHAGWVREKEKNRRRWRGGEGDDDSRFNGELLLFIGPARDSEARRKRTQ